MDYIIRGEKVSEQKVRAMMAAAPPKARTRPVELDANGNAVKKFIGFRVTGYAPGRIEAAKADHKKQNGGEAELHLRTWMKKHRPSSMRKPFEIESAAYEFAELAK